MFVESQRSAITRSPHSITGTRQVGRQPLAAGSTIQQELATALTRRGGGHDPSTIASTSSKVTVKREHNTLSSEFSHPKLRALRPSSSVVNWAAASSSRVRRS